MVVEPVEDFGVGAVGQGPVREVRLPAFVGLFGGESGVGAFGAFAWLWGDQAVVVQDGPDRGGGGHGQALSGEVGLEGDRAGVEALGGEFFAEVHDGADDVVGDGAWVAGGSPGARIDCFEAAFTEPRQ